MIMNSTDLQLFRLKLWPLIDSPAYQPGLEWYPEDFDNHHPLIDPIHVFQMGVSP